MTRKVPYRRQGGQTVRPGRRAAEIRRARAAARAEANGDRTPSERLDALVDAGHAHCAEARRLAREIREGES